MSRLRITALFAAMAVLASPLLTATESQGADADAAARARAEAAASALGSTLKQALQARMLSEGPLAAVDFCHQQAQPLTAKVAAEHGVRLGRIGVRNRNAQNAVGGWQQAALEAMATTYDASLTPPPASAQRSADGTQLNYARAIRTEGPCLLCHGTNVNENLLAAIRQRYPDDTATGFTEGELRGLLWVEVPLGDVGTN